MTFALLILALVVLASPIAIVFHGLVIQGLVAVIAAVLVAVVALRIRPGEARFLSSVIGPIVVVGAIPAIWMLIQVLPMQNVELAHPVWKSAATALGHPVAGRISIDPGATLISFVRYISIAAIVLVATAVATDRRRAEWLLLAVMGAATLNALMTLTLTAGAFTFFSGMDKEHASIIAADGASLGIIFATAAALQFSELGKAQRSDDNRLGLLVRFSICLMVFATCLVAVVVQARAHIYYAAVGGLLMFSVALMIRRFNLGPWGISAIVSTMLLFVIYVVAVQSDGRTINLTVNFANQASPPLVGVTQRILAETGWLGSGAGTFADILPIYQGIDELAIGHVAPTAAAAVAVEMGWPFFLASLMAIVAVVFFLTRCALRRQRDSYYCMAGASCAVAAALLYFGNYSLLTTPISIVLAAAIGLAIAQSKSRLN